jgi:hypothetical protein
VACSITITETAVAGVLDASGTLTHVHVAGTYEGCARIELRVSCESSHGGVLEGTWFVEPVAVGSWEIDIPVVPSLQCARCGGPITFTATCLTSAGIPDPDCPPARLSLALPCPSDRCPSRVSLVPTISPDCNSDGTRTVNLDVVVDASPTAVVRTRLLFGDGHITPETGLRHYVAIHRYDVSRGDLMVLPAVRITSPSGCDDWVFPSITIPRCEATKPPEPPAPPPRPVCPRIEIVSAVSVTAIASGCQVLWVADTVPPAAHGLFTWRFDGGAPEAPRRDLRAVAKVYSTSGAKWVEVFFRPDETACPESRTTGVAELVDCERSPGEQIDGCFVNRIGMVVALATSLVALAMALFCPHFAPFRPALYTIAAGAFLVFVVLLILWLLCEPKPCNWGLLLTAQAFYAAGLLLVNLAHCCRPLMWVGVAIALAGIGMMLVWALLCRLSFCRVAIELGAITLGLLIPIFAIVFVCGTPGFLGEDAELIPATVMAIFDGAGVLWLFGMTVCLVIHDGMLEEPDIPHGSMPSILDRGPMI